MKLVFDVGTLFLVKAWEKRPDFATLSIADVYIQMNMFSNKIGYSRFWIDTAHQVIRKLKAI